MKLSDSESISVSRVLRSVWLLNFQVLGLQGELMASMCTCHCGA